MTFMIERLIGEESAVVFRVCGRVDIECLNTLKELIESESDKIVLDLSEVTLANREAATFLAECKLKRYQTQ